MTVFIDFEVLDFNGIAKTKECRAGSLSVGFK